MAHGKHMTTLRRRRMSETWYGRPELSPSDPPGEEYLHNPSHPTRTGGYPSYPRHGAASAPHHTGSHRVRGDGRPPADRRPPVDERPAQEPAADRTARPD